MKIPFTIDVNIDDWASENAISKAEVAEDVSRYLAEAIQHTQLTLNRMVIVNRLIEPEDLREWESI